MKKVITESEVKKAKEILIANKVAIKKLKDENQVLKELEKKEKLAKIEAEQALILDGAKKIKFKLSLDSIGAHIFLKIDSITGVDKTPYHFNMACAIKDVLSGKYHVNERLKAPKPTFKVKRNGNEVLVDFTQIRNSKSFLSKVINKKLELESSKINNFIEKKENSISI